MQHRRPSSASPLPPNWAANPPIMADGYPDSLNDYVFGTTIEADAATNAPEFHIGGFPHLSREDAEQAIEENGYELVGWYRDPPMWGDGFAVVKQPKAPNPGALYFLCGTPVIGKWHMLTELDSFPERVRNSFPLAKSIEANSPTVTTDDDDDDGGQIDEAPTEQGAWNARGDDQANPERPVR